MVENIIYYLITTGAISGIIIFLGRNIISNYFSKNLEEYKTDLEKMRLEHQIMFSKLHQKRAEVIETLFSKLVKLSDSMELFVDILEQSEPTQKDKLVKYTSDNYFDFRDYFKSNEIYFHDDITNLADSILGNVANAWNKKVINLRFINWDNLPFWTESKEEEMRDLYLKNWMDAYQVIKFQLPKLKSNLKKELQKLLGV